MVEDAVGAHRLAPAQRQLVAAGQHGQIHRLAADLQGHAGPVQRQFQENGLFGQLHPLGAGQTGAQHQRALDQCTLRTRCHFGLLAFQGQCRPGNGHGLQGAHVKRLAWPGGPAGKQPATLYILGGWHALPVQVPGGAVAHRPGLDLVLRGQCPPVEGGADRECAFHHHLAQQAQRQLGHAVTHRHPLVVHRLARQQRKAHAHRCLTDGPAADARHHPPALVHHQRAVHLHEAGQGVGHVGQHLNGGAGLTLRLAGQRQHAFLRNALGVQSLGCPRSAFDLQHAGGRGQRQPDAGALAQGPLQLHGMNAGRYQCPQQAIFIAPRGGRLAVEQYCVHPPVVGGVVGRQRYLYQRLRVHQQQQRHAVGAGLHAHLGQGRTARGAGRGRIQMIADGLQLAGPVAAAFAVRSP